MNRSAILSLRVTSTSNSSSVAFGIAGAVGAVPFAAGGLRENPKVGGVVSLSLLFPTAYTFSPAVADVATRVLTNEGWDNLRFRPNVSAEWEWYIAAWLGTNVLIGAGFWLYSALGQAGLVPAVPAGTRVGTVALVVSLTLRPAINTLVAIGEEFGWRAYPFPKLKPLGVCRALIVHEAVWGVWH